MSFVLRTHVAKVLDHIRLKQILRRLPVALAQVQAGSTSENLLNGIRQIIYSIYGAKEIIKKVYNNIMNIMNSIKQ